MNKNYTYENYKYWDAETWQEKLSPIGPLAEQIGVLNPVDESEKIPEEVVVSENPQALPEYSFKTGCVNDPAFIEKLYQMGLHYEAKEMGGTFWLILVPNEIMESGKKAPLLLVMHREIKKDPYWNIKLLTARESYCRMAARRKCILLFVVTELPCTDRMYVNILQEAFTIFPADVNHVYLDVTDYLNKGRKLAEAEGFVYRNEQGEILNPDAAVVNWELPPAAGEIPENGEQLLAAGEIPENGELPPAAGEIPENGELPAVEKLQVPASLQVLDITRRWEDLDGLFRNQVCTYLINKGFDPEKVKHSDTGRKMAEGMDLEYRYRSLNDPEFVNFFRRQGISYEVHDLRGQRWAAMVPTGTQPDEKLPVLCVMTEVNYSNDHLAVSSVSQWYEYTHVCANGEAIVIHFALESVEDNDMYSDVIAEIPGLYPQADMTRVYMVGHSHNAYYTFQFAMRHPDLITAFATGGVPCGILTYADSGIKAFSAEDDELEKLSLYDMPMINIAGCQEGMNEFPVKNTGSIKNDAVWASAKFEDKVRYWQRRTKAFRCPVPDAAEIEAVSESPFKAARMLGIPADRYLTETMDGFEHYIADVKNNDGKYHLRVVGIEAMTHVVTPHMEMLAWDFMRRFARDPKTKEIIDLC